MLRLLTPAFALALLVLPNAARAQDPAGVWLRENGRSKVRIVTCGGALCGSIAWLKDASGPGHVG